MAEGKKIYLGAVDLGTKKALEDISLLKKALQSIGDVVNGLGMEKYWGSQAEIIGMAKKALDEFRASATEDTATELIRAANALMASGEGAEKAVHSIRGFTEAMQEAKDIAPLASKNFSAQDFSVFFGTMSMLEDYGINVRKFFTSLTRTEGEYASNLEATVSRLTGELESKTSEAQGLRNEVESLQQQIDSYDYDTVLSEANAEIASTNATLRETESTLRNIQSIEISEFINFLRGHGIDPSNYYLGDYFEAIRTGAKTSSQAIAEFKLNNQTLFEEPVDAGATIDVLSTFDAKLEAITESISEMSNELLNAINGIAEGGVNQSANAIDGVTKSIEGLSTVVGGDGSGSIADGLLAIIDAINRFAGEDLEKINGIRGVVAGIGSIKDIELDGTTVNNISKLLTAASVYGNTAKFFVMPNFSSLRGLTIDRASIKALADYLPKMAADGLDYSKLRDLDGLNFSSLANVQIDKSIGAISKFATSLGEANIDNVNKFLTGLDFSKVQDASVKIDKGLGTVINALVKLKSLNDGDLSSVLDLPFENLGKIAIKEGVAESISALADSAKQFAESKAAIKEIVDFLHEYQSSSASQTPKSPIMPLDVVDFGNGAEKIRKAYNGLSQDDDDLRSKMEQSTVVGKKYIATLQEIVSYKKDEKTNETVPSGAQTIVTYDFKKYRDEQAKNQKQVEDEANAYTRLRITIGAYMAQLNSSISTSREVGVVNDNNVKSLSDIVAKLGLVKRATESQEPGKFREIAKEFLEIKASADEYKRAVDNASKAQAKVVKDDKSRQAEIDSYNKLQYTLDGYIAKLKDSVSASEKSGIANSENVENLKTTIELLEELSASLKSQDVGKFKEFNSVYLVLRNFAGEYQRLTDEETEAQRQSERNAEAARKESDEYVRLERDINTYVASLKKRIEAAREAGVADDESVAKLQRIIESLEELSNSASTPGNAGIEAIDSELIRLKRDGDEAARSVESVVNASIKSSADAIREKEEALKAVSKYEQIRKQIANDINRSSKAENGRSAEDYSKLKGFATEVENLYEQYKHHDITAAEFADRLREIGNSAAGSANNIRLAGEMTKSFSARIKDSFKSLTAYFGAHRAIMLVIRYMRDLVKTSIELDKEMGNLRIVTNESTESLENYSRTIANTAKEISASMTDLITATTTFARLGYSLDDSSILAKYTAMLQQVGDIDASSAQDAVTAITKAFADEVDINNIESVMDRLVVVGRIIAHVCSNACLVIGYNGQSRFGIIA